MLYNLHVIFSHTYRVPTISALDLAYTFVAQSEVKFESTMKMDLAYTFVTQSEVKFESTHAFLQPKDPQVRLEQLKLSKTDTSTWS
jgi:hypothetical protein